MSGHPILPAGFNSAPMNGDEIDGAGYNEPIWPFLFDSFVGFKPLLLDENDIAMFETECPDYSVSKVTDTIVLPAEIETIEVRKTA